MMPVLRKFFLYTFTIIYISSLIIYTQAQIITADYYFDAENGSDSNDGTTPATAWQTVTKFNATTFPAGSVIAFRDSMDFRGYWGLTENGTYSNRILVTNWYGSSSEDYPHFKGSVALTNWTDQGGNIWRCSTTVNPAGLWVVFSDSTRWVYPEDPPNAEFEYRRTSTYVEIYSPSDPDSRYVSVEAENGGASQTSASAVFYTSGDYITFQYLKASNSAFNGFMVDASSQGVRIYDCVTSYNGSSPPSGSSVGGNGIQIFGDTTDVRRCTIYESGSHGIQLIATGNTQIVYTTIDSCILYDNFHTNGFDIQTYGATGAKYVEKVFIRYNLMYISNWYPTSARYNTSTIMGNFFSSQGGQGLTNNVHFIGNIVYHRQGNGIQMQTTADTVYIYNNMLCGYGTGNVYDINIYSSAQDEFVRNNIIYNTTARASGLVASSGTFENNLYWRTNSVGSGYGTLGTDYIIADPEFTDFANRILTLQGTSPAIDAGMTLDVFGNNYDFLRISRPQGDDYDIGAYEFITGGAGNNAPNQPSNPNPPSGATNQPLNLTITWSCTDPDGDPLTYDIYFGTNSNPPLVSSDHSSTSFNPGQLNNSTTYYWKIVAKDNQGAATSGPVWNFTTEAAGGGDVTPPELVGVQIVEADQVVLDFSEPLDASQVSNLGNYIISDQIQVLAAELNPNQTRICLTTDEHLVEHIYTTEIHNLTDLAGNVISSQANSAFYKKLDFGAPGYIEHLIEYVDASATTDTSTSPQKTLDGLVNGDPDPNSRWAAQVMPQWIQYDLGEVKDINLIAVSFFQWNTGRIYEYSIQISDDGNNWNEIVSNQFSSNQAWTFNELSSVTARYIRVVCLANNVNDWAGVWEARVFEPDYPTSSEQTKPQSYALEQNYPNPFNPNTIISWQSPVGSWQTLKVYDVLGNEVATLVDEYKPAGKYEVEFSAKGGSASGGNAYILTSGIYFYILQSGEYIETKKMVLLK